MESVLSPEASTDGERYDTPPASFAPHPDGGVISTTDWEELLDAAQVRFLLLVVPLVRSLARLLLSFE